MAPQQEISIGSSRFHSPLRYPGGKAALSGFLAETIKRNGLESCAYLEPFAGGAGAALQLLVDDVVSELYLNDADPRIHAFWLAALNHSERFADAILSVPLTIDEWQRQREVCSYGKNSDQFALGFATFYLNRCNRSGIIIGAAPIGGYDQGTAWKMSARFYRETLAKRVLELGRMRSRIKVTNFDASQFLRLYLPNPKHKRDAFVYLDPPYRSNSTRLYMNLYEDADHIRLADFIQRQNGVNWLMSYNDCPFIRDLYAPCHQSNRSLWYSLQRKRSTEELIISPPWVTLPVLQCPDA